MKIDPQTTDCRTSVLVLLSLLTGVVAGLGAVLFRILIAFFHNLLFFGQFSISYDANSHTPPSPWGPFVIIVPLVGAFLVVYLVKNFAPEAKGHGVPEVMDAIYYNNGAIRPVVAAIKSLASAISIGSGGSVGREGPIVQIGSAFGSSIGQFLRLPSWQLITLVASGAGAGIAATFNTPIGGLLFATEIILPEVSARTLIPVMMATAVATYLAQFFFGVHPAFVIPDLDKPYFHFANPLMLLSYIGLGLLLGVISVAYIRSIYSFEDFFEKAFPANDYLRHIIGMLPVGLIWLFLEQTAGHYYIDGVGYATVEDILSESMTGVALLISLCFLKLLATSLTLGSGGSGGIFSPALFMGATLGGAYGLILEHLIPTYGASSTAYAVAGMAGVVGGVTGAALTAIVMTFEMTLDYSVIVPITITVALTYGVRRVFCRESIYTMKLARRGHTIPEELRSNVYSLKHAEDFMDRNFTVVPAQETLLAFAERMAKNAQIQWYIIADSANLLGIISREHGLAAICGTNTSALVISVASSEWISVGPKTSLYRIISQMNKAGARLALVGNSECKFIEDIKGVISHEEIAEALKKSAALFPE